MLDVVRSVETPFVAPALWTGPWEGRSREVSVGGGHAIILGETAHGVEPRVLRGTCPLEARLHASVAQFLEFDDAEARWAVCIDGWRGDGEPPAHIVDAIRRAVPMPTTFHEVCDEVAYWAWRTYSAAMSIACDGEDPVEVLSQPFAGDPCLDLTVLVRLQLLRPQLLHALDATSIEEVATRFELYRQMAQRDPAIEAALARDLAAILKTQPTSVRKRGTTTTRPTGPSRRRGVRDPRVTDMLLREPRPTDRAIGRELGVSQSTVGAERRRLIEAGTLDPNKTAVVERKGVLAYRMKPRRHAHSAKSVPVPADLAPNSRWTKRRRAGPPSAEPEPSGGLFDWLASKSVDYSSGDPSRA